MAMRREEYEIGEEMNAQRGIYELSHQRRRGRCTQSHCFRVNRA